MLADSVDFELDAIDEIDDLEWSIQYRDKANLSRAGLLALRQRQKQASPRYGKNAHKGGADRSKASLANGVHRRCNKRSLFAALS